MKTKIFTAITISVIALMIIMPTSMAIAKVKNKMITEVSMNTFYHKPSYANFRALLADYQQEPIRWQNEENFIIFSAIAFENNPELLNFIIKNFPNYNDREKDLVVRAFGAMDNKAAFSKITNQYDGKQIVPPKYITKEMKKLIIGNDARNLDLLWSAYFASGDKEYIKNILTFINQDNFLLLVGYEIVNRNYICEVTKSMKNENGRHISICPPKLQDLEDGVKKHYPTRANEKFLQALIISSAIWSMDSNAKNDPLLKKNIQTILHENMLLDYWQKINEALK